MTKAQRRAKARRTGAKRRKANAAKAFLKKMNPGGLKGTVGALVRKLKGGGYSVTPIKGNRGGIGRVLSEYGHQRRGGSSRLGAIRKAVSSTRRNSSRRRRSR